MKKEILRYGSVHPMNPATALRFDGSKAGRGWKAIFPERLYPARVVVADHERGEERRSSVNHPKSGAIPFLFLFFLPSLSLSIERLFVPPFLSSPRYMFESRPSSKRNKLNLAGFQRSWRNSSNRPTRFSSRVRIF